ncbi:hypothetical protein ACFV3E_41815 [Streptomyces sp. NPDC059718]
MGVVIEQASLDWIDVAREEAALQKDLIAQLTASRQRRAAALQAGIAALGNAAAVGRVLGTPGPAVRKYISQHATDAEGPGESANAGEGPE